MDTMKKQVAGVILAAGRSSRMGRCKQLLPFGKFTILDTVIDNARHSELGEIILVLGHASDLILETSDFSGIRTVINIHHEKGQASSLVAGLEAVSGACMGVMFLLGDQPLVTTGIINRLIQAFETGTAPLIIPFCNGRRGNPVIFHRSLFHRLGSLTGDAGARVLFGELASRTTRVDIPDPSILVDVDTPEDYEKLMGTCSANGGSQ
ncbi:MAG: nucleotidyltransferase family protein [Pseudomonadota bacterium]